MKSWINPYNSEIIMCKLLRPKCFFFQFEIVINVLVSCYVSTAIIIVLILSGAEIVLCCFDPYNIIYTSSVENINN